MEQHVTPTMPVTWVRALAKDRRMSTTSADETVESAILDGAVPQDDGGAAEIAIQLRVVRLLYDWLSKAVEEAGPGNTKFGSALHNGRATEVAVAAAEATALIGRPRPQAAPTAVEAWAEVNVAIGTMIERKTDGPDLLQLDTLRNSSRVAARRAADAVTALGSLGQPALVRAMAALGEGLAALGNLDGEVALERLERAVIMWGALLDPHLSAHTSAWWSRLAAAQLTLAEALCTWLDGVGAGGDVAHTLSSDRQPVREAASHAALICAHVGSSRAADTTSLDWQAQQTAAHALQNAAHQTALVTRAGSHGIETRALDEGKLRIAATAASASWLEAAEIWAALGEDRTAHACRTSAVALGAVSVLDGITAATLGWSAREAWRALN